MIIISYPDGQLGNQLFTFAHFIAHSKEHGYVLCNPAFSTYAKFFSYFENSLVNTVASSDGLIKAGANLSKRLNSAGILFLKTILRFFFCLVSRGLALIKYDGNSQLGLIERKHLNEDGSIKDQKLLRKKWVLTYDCHFRDHYSVKKHAASVREIFAINQQLMQAVNSKIAIAREGCEVLIGLHIRRGDYAYWNSGRYYYEIEQYVEFMDQITELFPHQRVSFLVCSNENLEKFKDKTSKHNCILGIGNTIEDLYCR